MKVYQAEDAPFFDYKIEKIGSLNIRGPVPDLAREFFVCVGAAQTFGRYVHEPYPDRVSKAVGIPALNLSAGGAGPSFFRTKELLDVINKSRFSIIQVLSGRAEPNTIFNSDGKATLEVRVPSLRFADERTQDVAHSLSSNQHLSKHPDLLVPIGLRMHSSLAYKVLCHCKDDLVCEMVINESRLRYVASMISFLRQITVPKVLLYFSERDPEIVQPRYPGQRRYSTAFDIEGIYPHFIDNEVMSFLAVHVDTVAWCISKRGKPHILPMGMTQTGPDGTRMEISRNDYYPSPEMHEDASDAVLSSLRRMELVGL